mmetsp:Transcript_95568/g.154167  ORF Transcript_95568/g.154167 Transcript_95568/m.154167 type:complete len:219 (-) Transcript_95568:561-1217(-)
MRTCRDGSAIDHYGLSHHNLLLAGRPVCRPRGNNGDGCGGVCAVLRRCRVCKRTHVCAKPRQCVGQDDDGDGMCLLFGLFCGMRSAERDRHRVGLARGYSLWHYCDYGHDLALGLVSACALRHCRGAQHSSSLCPSSTCCSDSASNPRKALVPPALCLYPRGRSAALRLDFYRNVLHFLFVVELQVLLRLRICAAGVYDPASRQCLRLRGHDILSTEC